MNIETATITWFSPDGHETTTTHTQSHTRDFAEPDLPHALTQLLADYFRLNHDSRRYEDGQPHEIWLIEYVDVESSLIGAYVKSFNLPDWLEYKMIRAEYSDGDIKRMVDALTEEAFE